MTARRDEAAALVRSLALVAVVLAVSVAAGVSVLEAPPRPREAGVADELFSAQRAMVHVRALAGEARPLGSPGHARARAYLLGRLRDLGLEAEVQTAVAVRRTGSRIVGAQVHNVVGRLRGAGDGHAVLLVAHYDSRSNTPGSGDDASGVATILEAVRAWRLVEPSPANDLVVLFADGEEIGLFGARAFAGEHRWAADIGAVVNFEARGQRGRSLMFETGPANAGAVRLLAAAARPSASSLSAEVYRRMPNDTDFSVFRDRGLPGLNFAFIGGLSAYHSALDTADALDRSSLQHHGDLALTVLRELGTRDLSRLGSDGDAVFFDIAGRWLAIYPVTWALPLALVPLALVVGWLAGPGRSHGVLWLRGLLAWAAALTGGAAAGWLGWRFLELAAPGFLRDPHGLPYDDALPFASLVVLCVAVTVLVFGTAARRAGDLGVAAGVTLGWSLAGVGVAWLLPGGSHLFLWPSLVAAVALIVAGRSRAPARLALFAVALLPALVLWSPVVRLLAESLTLRAAPVLGLAVSLPIGMLAPHLGLLSERAPWAKAAGLGVLALAMTASAVAADRIGPERPRVSSLFELVDADSSRAWWLSQDAEPSPWVAGVLGRGAERGGYPGLLPGSDGGEVLRAETAAPELPPPVVETVSDVVDEARRLTLRVRSPRGAPVARLVAGSLVQIRAVEVAGRRVELEDPSAAVDLTFYGLPASGLEVGFEMLDRQPLEIKLLDRTWGLPGATPPRPADTIPATTWWSDSVWVGTTVLR